jgi:hypothetical protein
LAIPEEKVEFKEAQLVMNMNIYEILIDILQEDQSKLGQLFTYLLSEIVADEDSASESESEEVRNNVWHIN